MHEMTDCPVAGMWWETCPRTWWEGTVFFMCRNHSDDNH